MSTRLRVGTLRVTTAVFVGAPVAGAGLNGRRRRREADVGDVLWAEAAQRRSVCRLLLRRQHLQRQQAGGAGLIDVLHVHVGVLTRLSADPARRLGRHRRRARRHNDETPILAGRRVDLDRNGGAELTLSGTGDQTIWGGFVDIPDALRQSIGVQLVRQQWQRRDLGDARHRNRGQAGRRATER
jgi:hypothetical protein